MLYEVITSGVLAVVAAGLVNGNIGPRGMSSSTRIVVYNFWEFMAFLANSFVFLLIGLVVDLPLLLDNWQAILCVITSYSIHYTKLYDGYRDGRPVTGFGKWKGGIWKPG